MRQAVKNVKKLFAWSYSRWNDYKKCPALAKYKHIEKLREPDNKATENGTIVHELAAQFVRGDLQASPPELKKLGKDLTSLRKADAEVEQEWAFNSEWQPVDWFAKDAWVRIKVDAFAVTQVKQGNRMVTTITVVDHKTGKERPDHAMQRSLYAVGAFIMFPDADFVMAEHWYTETGKKGVDRYMAKQLPVLKQQWEQRTRAMMSDTSFAPRPGTYCRWCHFRKENGGPCQF